MSWPWETRTSTCRNFATISSGLYRFLAIAVLLDVETYLKSDHFVGGGSLGMFIADLLKSRAGTPQPASPCLTHTESGRLVSASNWPRTRQESHQSCRPKPASPSLTHTDLFYRRA